MREIRVHDEVSIMKYLGFIAGFIVFFSLSAAASAAAGLSADHLAISLLSYFGVGVLLAFTPCVLPMVPILSSIIIGQEQTSISRSFKLSLVFVLSMAFTYAIAGMMAGYLGSTLQTVMQVPSVIIGFSLVFVVMALTMFGALSFSLPRFISHPVMRVNQSLKGGGYVGVILMGVFSTLIASPCVTPPLLAILAYVGQSGNSVLGGLALFSLALGMGLPLLLVGVGQGALLPKSGVWMTYVKKLFGIMMLGLAVWMLSRILPDNITTLLWSALLIIGAVAMGVFNINPETKLPLLLHGVSVFVLIFGVVLLANVVTVNGFANNILTQSEKHSAKPNELFTSVINMDDLQNKLNAAKKNHQPVMIEFWASWCPACKSLDKNVLSNAEVQQGMKPFVNYRVDLTDKNDDLMQIVAYYQVYGTPSVVFYDRLGARYMTDAFDDGITKTGLMSVFKKLT